MSASRWISSRWVPVRAAVLERDRFLCQIRGPGCTGVADEVDHIVPRSEGGALYDPDNLRASCGTCNRVRNNRAGLLAKALNDVAAAQPSREW